MPMFHRKHSETEARQFLGTVESANEILAWIGAYGGQARRVHSTNPELGLYITFGNGSLAVNKNDWVVLDLGGGFYPIRPVIFEALYYPVAV